MPWNLTGNANTNPATDFIGTTDSKDFVVRTNNTEVLRINSAGSVGIGTTTPTSKLEIAAQDGMQITGFEPFLTLKDSNSGSKRARIQTARGEIAIFTNSGVATGQPSLVIKDNSNTLEIHAQDGMQIVGFEPFVTLNDSNSGFKRGRIQVARGDIAFFADNSLASGLPSLVIKNDSNTLEVHSQEGMHVVGFEPFITLDDSNSGFKRARIQNARGSIALFTDNGLSTGIPALTLEDSGTPADGRGRHLVTIDGTVTVNNDVVLSGADCAEEFDVCNSEGPIPGAVVVIGTGGILQPCEESYDKKVAGVVSGGGPLKPGIILDRQPLSLNRHPIALVGKVFCRVDASYASIEVGDLLTTSKTKGHGMKALDPLRAFGATIGKALDNLESGQGIIPVLVALQ
jgi:hypothetical protein